MERKYSYPDFDPSELVPVRTKWAGMQGMMENMHIPGLPKEEPVFERPITAKENLKRYIRGENPCWLPNDALLYSDHNGLMPRQFPDFYVAHAIADGLGECSFENVPLTGTGWFGLEWVYVPQIGGATVKPGNPKIEDMNDWEKILEWPDLDAVDWKGIAEGNREYLDTPQHNVLHVAGGFWERLISLMDVAGAAMALIDDEQKDALHDFFDKYADLLIEQIRRSKQACDIDGVYLHDDWGHQNSAFFSLETCREMIVPYAKRVVDFVHSEDMIFELYSCGKNETLVPAMIDIGVDIWSPQPINDVRKLARQYKGQGIYFATQEMIPVDPFAPEEEAKAYAKTWFEEVKDLPICLGMPIVNKGFVEEVYRLSREYYK